MKKSYLRYFIEYLMCRTFIGIIRLFSIDQASKICGWLGRNFGKLFLREIKVAKTNLELTYPNLSQKEISCIINKVLDNAGRLLGEYAHLGVAPLSSLDERVEVIGRENIPNEPVLIMTGHFANWELILQITPKLFHKIAVTYRKINNPFIDKYVKTIRSSGISVMIEKGSKGAYSILQAIKQKCSIIILIDQKANEGIETPFLGRPAMTSPALATLSLKFGYPILPMQIIRTNGVRFKVIIHPQIETQDQNISEIMQRANNIIENWIHSHPDQWLCWLHKRWKK